MQESNMPFQKYKPFPLVDMPNGRKWPDKVISRAPTWCSVDLRDGNQALVNPMNIHKKIEMFKLLLKMGFKEIEVGFPAASETEYLFVRALIEQNMVPEDVTIQVLTQCREHLIKRTFEAIRGAKRVIIHLYNSTSTLQRRVVFHATCRDIIKMAVEGTTIVKKMTAQNPETEVILEYSPESFTGTELEFSFEICQAVINVWQPTSKKKIILNLPSTVEMSTPNIYADQIEWFCNRFEEQDQIIISLHTHNDRGTGVAASELGLLAGGQRIEGTIFGNGERTGNVDIVTLALNMMTQGINPMLNISNINEIRKIIERCTELPIHPRHPYVGELVFTAFSGSHQDAIRKGLSALEESESKTWEVPYLVIDPSDIGQRYTPIRINSQSGKGGVAFILEQEFGFSLPRDLQIEFSKIVKESTDKSGKEIKQLELLHLFRKEYFIDKPLKLINYEVKEVNNIIQVTTTLSYNDEVSTILKTGKDEIVAFCNVILCITGISVNIDKFDLIKQTKNNESSIVLAKINSEEHGKIFGFGQGNELEGIFSVICSIVNRMLNIEKKFSARKTALADQVIVKKREKENKTYLKTTTSLNLFNSRISPITSKKSNHQIEERVLQGTPESII